MKIPIFKTLICSSALMVSALVIYSLPQSSRAQTSAVPAVAEAAVPSATPVAPPPNFVPTSPFGQVARLTQAGVDQTIVMAFVTNSSGTFNLDPDRIIYLSDLGAPTLLVTAMMQRDQQLQQQFNATQAAQQMQQPLPNEPAPVASLAAESTPTDTTPTAAQTADQPEPVTLNYFNDSLAPYGSWVVVNGYGRCWRPTVCVYNSTWQPYCDQGQWTYTDCGWYWNSSYAWGATFHYGRWFRDTNLGWCWYPDTVWAPSWVTWRYSNNYCGWAPLPPRTTYQAGVGIVYNGGGVSVGFGFGLGASCFTFVPTQNFCSPHPRNYCVPPTQVTQIYNNTTVINNYNGHGRNIANQGIAVQNISVATHAPIRQVPVHQMDNSFAHGNRGQSFDHSGHNPGFNRSGATGNTGTPRYPMVPPHSAPAAFMTGQNPARPLASNNQGNNHPAQNRFPTSGNQQAVAAGGQFTHVPMHDQPGRNNQITSVSQHPVTPAQTSVSSYHPQSMPANPLQTPHNYVRSPQPQLNGMGQNQRPAVSANRFITPQSQQQARTYSPPQNMSRQNYSQRPTMVAPQRTAPNIAFSSPSQGSGRVWNQGH